MTLSPRHLRLMALGLAVGLAFTATLVWAAPGVSLLDPPRTGYDPLSSEEQEQARTLAVQHARVCHCAERRQPERTAPDRAPRGIQSRRCEAAIGRAAPMYIRISTTATPCCWPSSISPRARWIASRRRRTCSLPLTQNETDRAFQLLLADAALMADIAAQYQTITGEALTQPEDAIETQRPHLSCRRDAQCQPWRGGLRPTPLRAVSDRDSE